MTDFPVVFLSSLIAGFVSSLGLGGGGILVLYLSLFLGMSQTQAGGINLIFFLPIAIVSILIHLKKKRIDYKLALKCVPFGVLGAVGGSLLAHHLDPTLIGKAFAVFVLILGVRELFSKNKKPGESGQIPDKKPES